MSARVAIITGAGRGIGKAIATGFARTGMDLYLISRTESELESVAEELRVETGRTVYTRVCDVGCDSGMQAAFQEVEDVFGRLDVAVANAGIKGRNGSLDELGCDDFLEPFRINALGIFNTCKYAAAIMRRTGGGNIITIGSGIGQHGSKNAYPYAATKAASWILTKSIAQEVRPLGISVNEIIPGPVKTAMNPGADGPGWKEPEDVVPLALFLANQPRNGPSGQSFSLRKE